MRFKTPLLMKGFASTTANLPCRADQNPSACDGFCNFKQVGPYLEALYYVCMFENPLPVMENETYTLEHELENST